MRAWGTPFTTMLIGKESMVDEVEDKMKWKETKDGVFSVKSMYIALKLKSTESFRWTLKWKSCVQGQI